MRKFIKNEKGNSIVEATILLPFCTIMIIAMYFAAIYACQKANLQANLQNALIYYKNSYSDTFVTATDSITYTNEEQTVVASDADKYDNSKFKNPYRFFGMKEPGSGFETFFLTMAGNMFFEVPGGENITVKCTTTNFVIYQALKVDVTQTIVPAVDMSMVGIDNTFDIDVSGTVVISDGDDFIRNTDFVIDLVENTTVGQKAKELVGKAKGFYDKFKNKFGVGEEE